MSLKFGQIQPSSAELAAIERLKKSPHTYNGKNCVATFSQQLPFLIRPVSFLQVVMTRVSSDDFKNWEDPTTEHKVICHLASKNRCCHYFSVAINLVHFKFVCIEDMHDIYLRGSVKITETYLMTFLFGIVDNKCDYFL